MEILIPKTKNLDYANEYSGVIAYGRAINGNTYVLKVHPDTNSISVDDYILKHFIIFKAQQSEIKEIFREDDEMGEGIMFDCYDDAIKGFAKFLESDCNFLD